jgi:ferric-chelate reductase [NAD(P)H]
VAKKTPAVMAKKSADVVAKKTPAAVAKKSAAVVAKKTPEMEREALHHINYGVYIVSSVQDGRANAQVANAVIQVCSEPPAVAVCLNKNNLTHEYVTASRLFAVSVLSEQTPMPFIGRFGFKSGRDIDKLEGVETLPGATGIPVVKQHATAYLEVKVERELDVWTHTVFAGKVVAAHVLSDGIPMTYSYYQDVKRGVTPRSAPSYVAPQEEKAKK